MVTQAMTQQATVIIPVLASMVEPVKASLCGPASSP
jgi:hypothetical protein